ncbi:MAG: phosphopentomutase [Bacilli bacterium]|nr:phosphopentomutase [Bacilli bacterium]
MKFKRIFMIVLDSLGVGETLDAANYKDSGANTLAHINENYDLFIPNLKKIGFMNTINMSVNKDTEAFYTIAKPTNPGKDSLSGHYELFGVKNTIPFKTFNEGFPIEILSSIEQVSGRKILGNKSCNNPDEIINELGDRQISYGALIVFTSADSDLQIAAHEDTIPIETLHEYCDRLNKISIENNWKIGRIIARPFTGTSGKYKLINSARQDYAVNPPELSVLDRLNKNNYNVIGIGKINDIFNKKGINKIIKASNNSEAMNKFIDIMDKNFTGLCVANLPDFDSLYGHTRDVEGYANAIEEFDVDVPIILNKLELDDLLIITADHGNDPTFPGGDHTRENVPVIMYSRNFKHPKRLEAFDTFANIGATIADNFQVELPTIGKSILDELE